MKCCKGLMYRITGIQATSSPSVMFAALIFPDSFHKQWNSLSIKSVSFILYRLKRGFLPFLVYKFNKKPFDRKIGSLNFVWFKVSFKYCTLVAFNNFWKVLKCITSLSNSFIYFTVMIKTEVRLSQKAIIDCTKHINVK